MKLQYVQTTYEKQKKNQGWRTEEFVFDQERENELINLYPQMTYQGFEGFGGAVTDSAGYVFSLLDDEQKKEAMGMYFGKDKMKYNYVRIPIDSCDFSLGHFEADSDEKDAGFDKFSFERVEKYILPLLDAAQEAYGGSLDIMLTPWSPPSYMKTNGERNHGGKLKPEYRERWAKYICRYIREYRDRGYRITRLTVQNEAKAVQTWDSCVYTAQEEKEFVLRYLWPEMKRQQMDNIEIYIWDHNKERAFEWAEEIFREKEAEEIFKGVAFHWYSGDHFEALGMIRERFPRKKLMLSEACIEYSKFAAEDYLKNAQKYAHDMIGNLNQGMSAFCDWNLILDEQGGPNHVGNFCDAPYLYDTKTGELVEGNILGYLWHFAHFLEAGALRIGISRYTDRLEVTAFRSGEKITVILLNRTEEEIPAYLRMGDFCARIVAAPNSIISGIITDI